jgi:hypothetical protein
MKATPTAIADVLVIEHQVFGDERGFFFESYNRRKFLEITGVDTEFVQDNHSKPSKGVLRGLHFQTPHPQGKLVRSSRARSMTSPWTYAHNRQATAIGWASNSVQKTINSCGFRPGWRMASWSSANPPSFFTRPPTTGTPSTSTASAGMTPP